MQLTWRQAVLVWQAKGYSHTRAADRLEERFGEGEGYGRSRITLLVTTRCEPCPPEVADFLLNEMEVLNAKRWANFQRDMTALLEAEAGPPLTLRDLREVARDAASSLADRVRAWLDSAGSSLEAFSNKASALLSGMDAKLDRVESKLDRVESNLDSVESKLKSQSAKLDSHGATLEGVKKTATNTEALAELITAKMDTSERRRRKEHLRLMGALLGLGLLLTCVSRSPVSNTPLQSSVTAFLGALVSPEMAKKVPAEQFVPDRPLPGQKLPPCSSDLQEKEMSGGCWMRGFEGPPCKSLFRHEDGCYRPIAADPAKGVGLVPEAPGQERSPPYR